jgi:putative intracellular protease/amidase
VRYAGRWSERWSSELAADVSTGGTDLTWSIGPAVAYTFGASDQYTLSAGYRRMVIEFDTDEPVDFDMSLSGVLVGFRLAFSQGRRIEMAIKSLESRLTIGQRVGRAALRRAGLHPEDLDAASFGIDVARALCVVTSHGVLDVGIATGVFASERTVPYDAFLDAGLHVDVANIRGGVVPVDPLSMKPYLRTPADDRMLADCQFRAKLQRSRAVQECSFADYDLIYLAGGWGAAFDFAQSEALAAGIGAAVRAGRVLGGICHGPLGLLRARRADGELLVRGRRLTAVTDRQVQQLGVAMTPLHPETALRAAGARFEASTHPARDFFANHWVADGDLITGQNQNAGPMAARLMLQRVGLKRQLA